ncbi:MAG: hypothetical protein LUE21_07530 [Oscillospiraceae bacterium]|nr:hypothetical protein [Oscillospiraceae bacterium]
MKASKYSHRLLSVIVALCLCLGLSCGAFASSGEAGTSSVPGVIEVDGGAASVSEETAGITVAGEVTDSSASGVLITDDDVGTSGLHITSGTYTLGGEDGYFGIAYDEDGVPYATEEGEYNSVIILNDATHESDLLYSQGSSENSLGTGIYAEGEDTLLLVENSYVWTSGAVRSAIGVYQLGTVVVKDSYIESTGALTCYKPVTRLLLSTCRANVFVGGSAYYYNTTAVSSDWGALSTDTGGANSTYLYAYNVLTDNPNGGYSTYADTNCFVEIYGSEMYSAEYGGFIACSGVLRIGSSDDASEEALLYADKDDLLTENKDSLVSAGRNAIVVHLVDSMGNNSGYDTTTGVLNISNTTLQTDKDTLTTRDYYNDENGDAYGECGYFLNYSAGSGIALRSTNIEMTLDNVTFDVYENAVTGRPIAIHSILNYDARGAVSVPDGEESLGQSIALSNMSVDGDIIHNDYQRPMTITTENVVINGAIVSGTCAAWNALWSDVEDNGLAENFDGDMIYSLLTKNETYETVWGVRLSLDSDSVWNVSGDSSLYSLSVEEDAVIQAAEGYEIEIYVDCAMSSSDEFYDYTTGTQVDSLPAGEYQGVVILVG